MLIAFCIFIELFDELDVEDTNRLLAILAQSKLTPDHIIEVASSVDSQLGTCFNLIYCGIYPKKSKEVEQRPDIKSFRHKQYLFKNMLQYFVVDKTNDCKSFFE